MKTKLTLIFTTTLSCVFVSASSVAADTFYVATNGNDANTCRTPGDPCLTIQAAVNKSADGDSISVASGNYPDPVGIFQRKNFNIVGDNGATLTAGNVSPGGPIVVIDQSKNVSLQNLTVSGDPDGGQDIFIFHSTAISINNCTIQNGGFLGFFINSLSTVDIRDSVVQNNGVGVRVDGNSNTIISSAPFSSGTTFVQGNIQGILVRSGVLGINGAAVIQNNSVGIAAEAGTIKSCCEDGDTRKIINNGVGVQVRDANVFLRGPLLISGNGAFAIRQIGGLLRLQDRVTIQKNGDSSTPAVVAIGAHLELTGLQPNDVQIVQNPGIGLLLNDNSSARIFNTLIANNGGHGTRAQALSTVTLIDSTAVMRNNGGKDLSCAPNSFGHGSNAGVQNMFCPGFDTSPDPEGR
jgi:hypothetical protein